MPAPDPQPTDGQDPGRPPTAPHATGGAPGAGVGPAEPGHTLTDDELVDEIGEESFPASDPPATY